MSDGLVRTGTAALLAGGVGLFDAPLTGVVLLVIGGVVLGIGVTGRRRYVRSREAAVSRVVSGLAATWGVMVLVGAFVYVLTGTTARVDEALFESAAGFSTVALTTLEPESLSLPIALFRGATQWIGGLLGVLTAVVALPRTMKGRVQIPRGEGRRADRLVPTVEVGRRRVFRIYAALTVTCGLAYLATGMAPRGAAIHAMTTVSTGGFSDNADSFVSETVGSRSVATVFMLLAGMSFFAMFWLLRGKARRFVHSPELRLYLAIVTGVTALLLVDVDGLSLSEALFTAASASSTTGLSVTDWSVFPPAALSVLLVSVATGAMGASAGSGLGVIRVWLLVLSAMREVRRQLEPRAVTTVSHRGRRVEADELDQLTGYQIAHFGLCAIGAFLLTLGGRELADSLWVAISVVSTWGPSPGTGPFGDATGLGSYGRLVLIPGMLAGRLSILPLILAVVAGLRGKDAVRRGIRRLLRVTR